MAFKAKILYVENDVLVRESIVAFLEDYNYEVYAAADGKEALDQFAKNRPDVLITDLDLPEISGIDLIKTIREISAELPVVVVS